jgi:hypothetical protein
VLATRPYVIRQLGGIPHSVQFNVCDFGTDQIASLVRKWFVSNHDLGSQLLGKIESTTTLREAAAVPLLLTCLCLLVEARGTAEFGESDIAIRRVYEWFVELLLEGWDAHRARRPENKSLIRLGIEVLTELSDRFEFDASFRDIDLVQAIRGCGQRLSASLPDQDILERVITQPGRLLAENPEDRTYRFRLQAFWDFFRARSITRPYATAQARVHSNESK